MRAYDMDWEGSDHWRRRHGFSEGRDFRRARLRADRKARLLEELIKYAVVTGLLLFFLRPIGVIVGVLWGMKLFQRYSRSELFPRLHGRWTAEELRRRGYRTRPAQRRWDGEPDAGPEARARSLIRRVGDDPHSAENLAAARAALEDLREVEQSRSDDGAPRAMRRGSQSQPVRMIDVVERAVSALRGRIEEREIEVCCDVDADGLVRGDPEVLDRMVTQLLRSAVDVLERSSHANPRLDIAMGENLAGTEVWIKIRHNGPPAEPEQMHEIIRPFYTAESDGTNAGFQLTLAKGEASGA